MTRNRQGAIMYIIGPRAYKPAGVLLQEGERLGHINTLGHTVRAGVEQIWRTTYDNKQFQL